LLKLVNEVLDLSKIEAGKMELDVKECNVSELLREIVGTTEAAAAENGNTLSCRIAPSLGIIFCDAAKFRNMVGQIVDNAVKFTQNGSVKLAAERELDSAGDWLVVNVIDTGIGIAPDQIGHLFEKFTVVDDSSSSKYGGTGLGLALSQRLSKLMGGEILVESAVGRGSRFTIRTPFLSVLPDNADADGEIDGMADHAFGSATLVPGDEVLDAPSSPQVLSHA
jgi:signal transduction histidine kinase